MAISVITGNLGTSVANTATSLTPNLSTNPSNGNAVLVATMIDSATGAANVPTMTGGTFTQLISFQDATNLMTVIVWLAPFMTSATTGITINSTGASYRWVSTAVEISGLANSVVPDTTNTNTQANPSGKTWNTGTGTTVSGQSVLFLSLYGSRGSDSPLSGGQQPDPGSPNNGYSFLNWVVSTAGASVQSFRGLAIAYKVVSSGGTPGNTVTDAATGSNSNSISSVIVTLDGLVSNHFLSLMGNGL